MTNDFSCRSIGCMDDDQVLGVLRAYPQIYLACHVEHRTRGSSASGLTSREASFLAHVSEPEGTSPAALARHLGISRSTLSAALARLEGLGLVTLEAQAEDGRRKRVRLTAAGRAAIRDNSVLDPERVAALLSRLDGGERSHAVEGLQLLARAALRLREEEAR